MVDKLAPLYDRYYFAERMVRQRDKLGKKDDSSLISMFALEQLDEKSNLPFASLVLIHCCIRQGGFYNER